MVQILEGKPSFAQSIASALGGGLGSGISQGAQFAQQMMMNEAKKKPEDTGLKERGIESIQHMRDIVSRGKTGWNFLNYATEEGRADRAAMDAAALNLERLAVEMQGRGVLSKPRFEYMVKRLPSSGKSDAENQAILDEWEQILGSSEEKSEKKKKGTSKIIFNAQNPEHQAKAKQLFKKFGDKEKVREKLKLEFEGL